MVHASPFGGRGIEVAIRKEELLASSGALKMEPRTILSADLCRKLGPLSPTYQSPVMIESVQNIFRIIL